jgi:hypothetical protein
MSENERFLDPAQRAAALGALEDDFGLTLTEAEALQAARLFFALVSSSALISSGAITQEVHSQLAELGQLAQRKSPDQVEGSAG